MLAAPTLDEYSPSAAAMKEEVERCPSAPTPYYTGSQ